MSYLGYTKHIVDGLLTKVDKPVILEIGVDKGQTTLPLLHNLVGTHGKHGTQEGFIYVGVDIKLRPVVMEQLFQMDGIWVKTVHSPPAQPGDGHALFWEANSLDWIPGVAEDLKFDLIMLDGDHNYYTVKKELNLLQRLCKPTTVFLCDDFAGRYSREDLWYSEKEEYADIDIATPKQEKTEKSGVKDAIIDFTMESAESWKIWCREELDACLMWRPDVLDITFTATSPAQHFPQWKLNVDWADPEKFRKEAELARSLADTDAD